jgi:hypothetical protein
MNDTGARIEVFNLTTGGRWRDGHVPNRAKDSFASPFFIPRL